MAWGQCAAKSPHRLCLMHNDKPPLAGGHIGICIMDSLDQLFRWAWYVDFGESPEETARRVSKTARRVITPAMFECDLSTSHFNLSAKKMLTQFKAELILQAKRNNLDGRAIAGAIAWEYEQNPRGRLSDYAQAPAKSLFVSSSSDGLGWGSMHGKEAANLRPRLDDTQLMCARMEAKPAVAMIAEFMSKMADLYATESDGIHVRDNPVILAGFYQAGESNHFVSNSAKKRRTDPDRANGVITLNLSSIPMAKWVHTNLPRFKAYKTVPTASGSVIRALATV